MKKSTSVLIITLGLLSILRADDAAVMTIPVDSPAFVFSPGNWVGDAGRGGRIYRQTWNPCAYFRVTWESVSTNVVPTLLLDASTYNAMKSVPKLAYNLDGVWNGDVPCAKEITVEGAGKAGKHVLTVYLKMSTQVHRWGSEGVSGSNVVRITGLRVGAGSKPCEDAPKAMWAMIVGDSITEGCGAYELECYSHLVGQALQTQGYEYAVNACGWSGWLHRGDNPPGDVPGYYVVTNSVNGTGGEYVDSLSRWNKIDSLHSLLDSKGRISAYGETGQEPSVITINYGTNDAIHPTNASDVRASMAQCLVALRKAAPGAHIFIIIPFGQYKAKELYETVEAYHSAHPDDRRLSVIDMGPDAARAIAKKGYWGDLHPNPRAHATFAAKITAQMMAMLHGSGSAKQ